MPFTSGVFTLGTGNPVVTGTTISSTWANNTLTDIATGLSTAVLKDGTQTITANLPMGGFRHTGVGNSTTRAAATYTSAADVQDGTLTGLTSVAGTNTITATAAISMSAYATNQVFTVTPANTNTGATTININSIGAKNIFAAGAACVGGEIAQNIPLRIEYDGTQFNIIGFPNINALTADSSPDTSSDYFQSYDASASGAKKVLLGKLTGKPTIATGRNIAARTNSGTPNTKLDISSDEMVVEDTGGNCLKLSTVSGTIDFGTTGANGLDAGSQGTNTWYYGWVIAKGDGTVAVLGSTSSSTPTMPTGYTFKALVTAAFSDGSTHFVKYRQTGNWCYFESFRQVLVSGSASTETAITINTSVPPNALAFQASIFGTFNVGVGGTASSTVSLRYITATDFLRTQFAGIASDVGGFGTCGQIPNVSQTLFYLFTPATNVSSIVINVDILGFKLPLGGE